MLAGDTAHIVPVWQGTRSHNARACATPQPGLEAGLGAQASLRHPARVLASSAAHLKAMIDLSVAAGRIFYPRNVFKAAVRGNDLPWLLQPDSCVQALFQRALLKPMPFYSDGLGGARSLRKKGSPVGPPVHQPAGAYPRRRGQTAR